MAGKPLAGTAASEVVEHVRRASAGIIATAIGERRGVLPWSLVARVQSQCELLEGEVLKTGPKPACQKGCAWCCYGTRLEVLAPEALVLADTLNAGGMTEQKRRVRETAGLVRGLSAEERHRQRTMCPLLDPAGGYCSVHSVRPIACRGHSSMRAADCEQALSHPETDGRIEKHLPLLLSHGAVAKGVRLALERAGLDARVLEGIVALDLALSIPDAGVRWARGERLFDEAAAGPSGSSRSSSRNRDKARRRARRRT